MEHAGVPVMANVKISRLSKKPQNPRKLEPLKFSGYVIPDIH